jgi:hypothetical protein
MQQQQQQQQQQQGAKHVSCSTQQWQCYPIAVLVSRSRHKDLGKSNSVPLMGSEAPTCC